MIDISRKYLTVAEVCCILNISNGHAYHMIYTGELPAIKLGYSWRIPIDALEERLREKLTYQQLNYNSNSVPNINSNKT